MRFPILVGEIGFVPDDLLGSASRGFPFQTWAASTRFQYPEAARDFLSRTGSAAEAYFARPFTLRSDVEYPFGQDRVAIAGDIVLELQARCGGYLIDAVVSDNYTSLAVEIDGLAFHHMNREQIAADYLRERRIVLKRYTVIRFTASEVFLDAHECWRQVDAILLARRKN